MKRNKVLPLAVTALTLLLCAALAAAVLTLYFDGLSRRAALQSANEPLFTRETAGRMLLWISPLFALWLAVSIAARLVNGPEKPWRSVGVPKLRGPMKDQAETPRRRRTRLALYLLAAGLIAAGVCFGGMKEVLYKAIKICSECIGLAD